MKGPDLDRERSERKLTPAEFLKSYNQDLPVDFPRASMPILREFNKENPGLFRDGKEWSLDQHRKKLMDWLPVRLRALAASDSN